MLGVGCHGGEGGEGRGEKKAEAYPIREGKYWGRDERGGSRNTEVGKERETLMCKVRKGAGTRREKGSRSTGAWEEAESPRGRAGRSTGL